MPSTIFTSDELLALRRQLDEQMQTLKKQADALATVEAMLREQRKEAPHFPKAKASAKAQVQIDKTPPTVTKVGLIGPQLFDLVPSGGSFADLVKAAVKFTGGQEFTLADIERILKERGIPMPEKDPRSAIATRLSYLCDKKQLIERTYQGKSRFDLSRFRNIGC